MNAQAQTEAEQLEAAFIDACTKRGLSPDVPSELAPVTSALSELVTTVGPPMNEQGMLPYLAAALEAWTAVIDAEGSR